MKKLSGLKKLINSLLIGAVAAIGLVVVFVLNATITASVSSKNKNDNTTAPTTKPADTTVEVMGNGTSYYAVQNGDEYTLVLTDKNQFSLSIDGQIYTGKYTTSDNVNLTLEFKGVDLTGSITMVNGNVDLNFEGTHYTFLERKQYTVNFTTNGGSDVASQQVLNGKYALKPVEPSKANGAFIGWYIDADYSKLFDFQSMKITENTTVYGRFADVTVGQVEYTASFMTAGNQVAEIKTIGGVVYNLPEVDDANFVGWFVSESGAENEVSYKYDGQVLSANSVLYPVYSNDTELVVSVDGNTITWTSAGINQMYTVEIIDADGTVVDEKLVNNTTTIYDLNSQAAGKYEVRVSANGKSGSAYKNVRVLNAVSYFNVVEGKILTFAKVDGATKYYVTVDCGVEGHNHKDVYLGSNTYYNFQNCQMKKGGINFTVTAVANNYESSVATFNYSLDLAAVENVVVDQDTDVVTWNKVENAVSYTVEVTTGSDTFKYNVGSNTEFSLKEFTGALTVSVTAVTAGYNSADATAVNYSKATLPTPKDIVFATDAIRWAAVSGAAGYKVSVNGVIYDVESNVLPLTTSMLQDGVDTYEVKILAVASDASLNSAYSDAVEAKYYAKAEDNGVLNINYSNGTLTWDPVFGAIQYEVAVVDMSHTQVVTSGTSAKIEFFQPGVSGLFVRWYDMNANASEWRHIDIYAYEVAFQTTGGSKVDSLYFAYGDSLVLPESAKDGYDFVGWYNSTMGVANNGVKYDNETVMGNTSVILFAQWTPKAYNITLSFDGGSMPEGIDATQVVYFENPYTLPICTPTNNLQAFAGWYTDRNGQGFRYTNQFGTSLEDYTETKDRILYAFYANIIDFSEVKENNETVGFSVSKGPGISYVTEVTIPATYTKQYEITDESGNKSYVNVTKPVTQIINFKSANTIKKISFPDTVDFIDYLAGFASTSALTTFEMYHTCNDDPSFEHNYGTYQGILYVYNEVNQVAGWEVASVPYAISGEITLMPGTTIIPQKAFESKSKITKMTIPYTVSEIQKQAFYYCSALTEVVFEETPDGEDVTPLTFGETVFYSCNKIPELNLPSRLAGLDPASFNSMTGLAKVNVPEGGARYTSIDGILYSADKKTVEYCPRGRTGEYTVPTGTYYIAKEAFASCTKITKVVFPEYVESIGEAAFNGCSGLKEVVFEGDEYSKPLSIATKAFYSSGLSSVTIPANCNTIEAHAFYGSSLRDMTINSKFTKENLHFSSRITQATSTSSTVTLTASYLNNLYLGAGVPEFDVLGAFNGSNDQLTNIVVDEANTNYGSIDGVLFDSKFETLIFYTPNQPGTYVIPAGVKRIGSGAFAKRTNIVDITFNYELEEIGDNAFNACTNLRKVRFEATPDGVTPANLVIGNSAFYGCTNTSFTKFILPERTVKIGNSAFYNDKFTEFVIPEGVTEIGEQSFYNLANLTKITLPSTLVKYGNFDPTQDTEATAIFSCAKLNQIIVAEGNPIFKSINNILYYTTNGVPTHLVTSPRAITGDVVIPSTVNTICYQAFYYNQAVTSIRFENNKSAVDAQGNQGELKVGTQAFYNCSGASLINLPGLHHIPDKMLYGCSSLEEFEIANTVTTLGEAIFYGCTKLTEVTFEEGGTEELIFQDCTLKSDSSGHDYTFDAPFTNSYITKIVIPERVKYIGQYFFASLYSSDSTVHYTFTSRLESVYIPKSVTSIGKNAFYGNSTYAYLKEVTFEEGSQITTIPDSAFGYQKLESFEIPATVTSIGQFAFDYNKKLTSIFIPKSVKSIGSMSFYYCDHLEEVIFEENSELEIIDTTAFEYSGIKEITIPASVKTIGNYAFGYTSKLKTVHFAENSSITSFGTYVFTNSAIESFIFPSNYTVDGSGNKVYTTYEAGKSMFSKCRKLTNVHISASVSSITDVFTDCGALETITVDPANVNIGDAGNHMLTNKNLADGKGDSILYVYGVIEGELVIPDYVVSLAPSVFANQFGITKVTIPNSVTSIGNKAFSGCTGLKEVIFEGNPGLTKGAANTTGKVAGTMGVNVFEFCSALTTVTLPTNLTTLPNYTFQYCISMKNLPTLPAKMTAIGQYAFDYAGLTSVTLPSTVKTLNTRCFGYNMSLTSVSIPNAITFGSTSFYHCENLKTLTLGDAITKFNTSAFGYCYSLETVKLPAKLTEVSSSSFDHCTGLKTVTYSGTTLKTIAASAFSGCASLETFVLPTSVTTINGSAFKDCAKYNPTITNKVTTVAANAFQNSGITTADLSGITTYDKLGANAFDGSALQSVKLGGTIINTKAFQNATSLTTVTFSSTTERIGQYAFDGCTALKSVVLPATLKYIHQYAFRNTGLEQIVIPAGVELFNLQTTYTATTIANTTASYAFANNANLKKVTFAPGSNIDYLPGYMFQNCTALEEIVLPTTVTGLHTYVFDGCSSLKSIDISNVTGFYMGKTDTTSSYTFRGCSSLESITLNSSITKLNGYMFQNCTSLTNIGGLDQITEIGGYTLANTGMEVIDMPNLKVMGTYAFAGASATNPNTTLKSVSIPNVNAITMYSFQYNEALESVDFGNNYIELPNGLFRGCKSLKNFTISENCTKINMYQFQNTAIESIVIPESVTEIGAYPFDGCENLKEITVPSQITALPNYFVRNCTSLEKITFASNNTLETIGTSAFEGTTSLTTIENFPTSVKTIGNDAFKNTAFGGILDLGEDFTNFGDSRTFANSPNLAGFNVDPKNKEFYSKDGAVYKKDGTLIFYPHNVSGEVVLEDGTKLSQYAFDGCNKITKIVLPSDLEVIPKYAFAYCTNIEEIVFPESLTTIEGYFLQENTAMTEITLPNVEFGQNLLYYAKGLKTVTFADGVTEVPASCFGYCENIETINLPETCTSMANYAFRYSGLKEYTMPNTITTVGTYTFANCTNLESVTVSANLSEAGNYMFYQDTALTSVVFPEGVTEFGGYTFSGCTSISIENVYLPSTLTAIPAYAFNGFEFTSFVVPASVKSIGNNAFKDCANLKSITLPAGLESLGTYVFQNCTSLTSLTVPSGVSRIENYAFDGCTALTNLVFEGEIDYIGQYAFRNDTNIKELVITGDLLGESTLSTATHAGIDQYAFAGWVAGQTVKFSVPEKQKALAPFNSYWYYNSSTNKVAYFDIVWNYTK